MTTHDRDKIIAAAKEAGLQTFITRNAVERFYAIAHEAGRVSRDAEIAVQQEHLNRGKEQEAHLHEQVKRLRDAILAVCCDPDGVVCISGSDGGRKVLQEALDATEPTAGASS